MLRARGQLPHKLAYALLKLRKPEILRLPAGLFGKTRAQFGIVDHGSGLPEALVPTLPCPAQQVRSDHLLEAAPAHHHRNTAGRHRFRRAHPKVLHQFGVLLFGIVDSCGVPEYARVPKNLVKLLPRHACVNPDRQSGGCFADLLDVPRVISPSAKMQFPAAHAAVEQSPEVCDHFELMLAPLATCEASHRDNPGLLRAARDLSDRRTNDDRAAPPTPGD